MTDIEKARGQVATIINQRYNTNPYKEDMISIALIEYVAGASLYQAIAKAKKEEYRFNGGSTKHNAYKLKNTGMLTFVGLDQAGLVACDQADPQYYDEPDRIEVVKHILMLLVHLPTKKFMAITGRSLAVCNVRKRQIRALLDLAPAKVGRPATV